jgi:hypothetical protein
MRIDSVGRGIQLETKYYTIKKSEVAVRRGSDVVAQLGEAVRCVMVTQLGATVLRWFSKKL